jgi:hypothetical protein
MTTWGEEGRGRDARANLSFWGVTIEAGLGGAVAPAPAVIHVERELVSTGGLGLERDRVELRLGIHLGWRGGWETGSKGRVFEESEGPIEDILGGGRNIWYIERRERCHRC